MPDTNLQKLHKRVAFSAWNIHGISDKVIGNKLQTDCFIDSIRNNDFIILTETWTCNEVQVSGYRSYVSVPCPAKNGSGGRLSGGVCLLYKEKLFTKITLMKSSKNYIWCKIDKSCLGTEQDIFLCGAYIPPHNSTHYSLDIFEELENDILNFGSEGSILLLGDLNARTGKYCDQLDTNTKHYLHDDPSENMLNISPRNNCDNILNNHGKVLLQICKNCDLRILNGRTQGDSFGNVTFHGQHGVSTVDYIICDHELFKRVDFFIVKPPTSISDHSQITAWLQSKANPEIRGKKELDLRSLDKLPSQFAWENDSADAFQSALLSPKITTLVQSFLTCDFQNNETGIEEAVNSLENIMKTAASHSLKRKVVKRRYRKINITTKKWFDKECRLKRHEVRKLANSKHRDPTNINIRESYHQTLNEYQTLIKKKQRIYKAEKRKELEEADTNSSSFWDTLKSMPDTFQEKQIPPVSQDSWIEHFTKLHDSPIEAQNQEQQKIKKQLQDLENTQTEPTLLQAPISCSEILSRRKLLKNKKASYSDLVSNEMIKYSCKLMPAVFEKLFNLILNTGIFPGAWCKGLISPIFKSGERADPGNYRGICVSSCLGKFFCLILNQRLTEFVVENKLLHTSQIGFLSKNRSSDHIFTLRTLIDNYIHKHNTKLYACFVDFKKAFDSIWHDGLLHRLLNYGIGGKMFRLIKNLYSKSSCAIKIDKYRTPFFKYLRGVRQGCILSPLLFNLFLNELPRTLNYKITDPVLLPNGEKLNTLLYADDLVLFSRSKVGLQNCLNSLESFCSTWLLEVNLNKTKIMIFQKTARKPKNIQFHYKNKQIEIAQEYTYLGIKLSPTGNFTLAQKTLCEKASNAMFKIHKYTNISKLSHRLAFKIFDATILPILTYGGEVWAVSTKSTFDKWDKSPIEKVHLKFCKLYLKVNRKASNIATRSELGRLPTQIVLMKKTLKYYLYLNNKDDNAVVKQAFILSKQLDSEKRKSHFSDLKSFLLCTGCPNINNIDMLTDSTINQILKDIEQKYLQFWKEELTSSTKLDFYRNFKLTFSAENYVDILRNSNTRKDFTKLRISNHSLRIETGRHCRPQLQREQRLCTFCHLNDIEDELHFLLHCTLYNDLRSTFNRKQSTIMGTNIRNDENSFQLLFMTKNKSSIRCTAKYIAQCFDLRRSTSNSL